MNLFNELGLVCEWNIGEITTEATVYADDLLKCDIPQTDEDSLRVDIYSKALREFINKNNRVDLYETPSVSKMTKLLFAQMKSQH